MILLGINLVMGWAAESVPYPLPRIASPVIDGRISTGEWDSAAQKYGFGIHASTKDLGLRQGFTLMGYDEQYLYLAVVTELPPEGIPLLKSCRFRDGNLIIDDGIEIWCARDAQIQYQYIVNDGGVVFDAAHSSKGMNIGWSSKWRFASGKADGKWVCELAIPLTDFGIAGNPDGKIIRFFVARNWKYPSMQSPFAGKGWAYGGYLLSPENPTIRIQSIGKLENQIFSPEGSIKNNTPYEQHYQVELKFSHSDMPSWNLKKEIAAGPGGHASFRFYADAGHIHQNASHQAELLISQGGETIFQEKYNWSMPRDKSKKWQYVRQQVSQLHFAYYPYLKKLIFHLDGLSNTDRIEAEISLNRKIVAKKIFSVTSDRFSDSLDTGDLKAGNYELKVSLFSKGIREKTLVRNFERIVFPWEHNNLGVTREVIPPFEPITYPAERNMKMSLKNIRLSKEGLYASLNLAGRELLAGTAEYGFTDETGNGLIKPVRGEFTEKSADRGIYLGNGRGRGFTAETKSITEYDGCTRFELTLVPDTGRIPVINSFHLDIPLDSGQIRLFHLIRTGTIRSNPAISIPGGEGEIWRSTDIPVADAYGNMHIYLWLGEMDRGISWFADNDRNFSVDDKQPVQQLFRRNGVLTLRINFINKPLALKGKRTIVFGMQPSPVRPMPAGWRSRKFVPPMHGGSNGYWGINAAYAGKYPVNYDWSFAEKLLEARRNGHADHAFVDNFLARHYGGKKLPPALKKHYQAHFHAGHNMVAGVGAREKKSGLKEALLLYFEEHSQDQTTPEWRVFQDEWDTQLFSSRNWLTDILNINALGGAGIRIVPSQSYCDFAVYQLSKWAKYGMGTYYDNTFPRSSYDTNMTAAYVREDGEIQPSACIWQMREYHKRTWIATRLMNRNAEYPIMKSVHMTNGMILPIVSWTDINLDLEWTLQDGTVPFPPELIEIEATGRQNGAWPHVLYTISPLKLCYRGPGIQNPIKDGGMATEWAMRVIYDILIPDNLKNDSRVVKLDQALLRAGYADRKATVHKYWERDYPVRSSSGKIKSTLVVNGKKGFLVAASWSDSPEKAAITFEEKLSPVNVSAIGPTAELRIRKNRSVTFDLPPYGSTAIEIEFK